jgi:hypothetical protein
MIQILIQLTFTLLSDTLKSQLFSIISLIRQKNSEHPRSLIICYLCGAVVRSSTLPIVSCPNTKIAITAIKIAPKKMPKINVKLTFCAIS